MLLLSWRGSLGGWRDWLRGRSSPDQHCTILIDSQLVDLDDFDLQIFEVFVIQAKLPLKCPVRYPSLALEHAECLIQHFLECHDQLSACLVSAPGANLKTMCLAWLTIYHR
jgi:hypothetical protein